MSQEPTAACPVEKLRRLTCGRSATIEVPSKFDCPNCGHLIQIEAAVDRVKGPIVWLAGNSTMPD